MKQFPINSFDMGDGVTGMWNTILADDLAPIRCLDLWCKRSETETYGDRIVFSSIDVDNDPDEFLAIVREAYDMSQLTGMIKP